MSTSFGLGFCWFTYDVYISHVTLHVPNPVVLLFLTVNYINQHSDLVKQSHKLSAYASDGMSL